MGTLQDWIYEPGRELLSNIFSSVLILLLKRSVYITNLYLFTDLSGFVIDFKSNDAVFLVIICHEEFDLLIMCELFLRKIEKKSRMTFKF